MALWPTRFAVATRAGGVGDDGFVDYDADAGKTVEIEALLLVPNQVFVMSPIFPPRVAADSPVHADLLAKQRRPADPEASKIETGFLTMDQSRRLVPLLETEDRAFSVPLVGVWVSGVSSIAHLHAWAAAARFHAHDGIADKATRDGSFLLAAYMPRSKMPGPAMYDVSVTGGAASFARYAATMTCGAGEAAEAKFLSRTEKAKARAFEGGEKAYLRARRDEETRGVSASVDAAVCSALCIARRAHSGDEAHELAASLGLPRPTLPIHHKRLPLGVGGCIVQQLRPGAPCDREDVRTLVMDVGKRV